jgi:N4-(beta-N-acetylglucosaminyl)-L-asparaginase
MSRNCTRRGFMQAVGAAAALGATPTHASNPEPAANDPPPAAVVIASGNGLRATAQAAEEIQRGVSPTDAVVHGVAINEADPKDNSVGYGGLPNEDGVVQRDASVMDGPTHRSGAVAGIERIMHPAQVALRVMRRTDHVLLVGAGALAFARAHGFPEQNLLTDAAREKWLRWKENLSDRDDWLAPDAPDESSPPPHGTINCLAVNAAGDLGGVTTTSGLAFKIPGRVGDSPIVGAGLYVDNEVGAAGSTGRGEAVVRECGAFATVEAMRAGMSPTEACLSVLRRMVKHVTQPRLKRDDGRPRFDVKMYALSRDGRFGAAAIWSGAKFAVHSDGRNRLETAAFLFERPPDMRRKPHAPA